MKIAIFTIIKNEAEFLPVWYRYYRKHFDENEIFIFDNDSTDRYGDYPNITRVHHKYDFDHAFLRRTAYCIMDEMLSKFDCLVFCDADEIILPNVSKYSGIKEYVTEKVFQGVCYAHGFEILSSKDSPPIDWNAPIIAQRHRWVQRETFYKPVISRIPLKRLYQDYKTADRADPDLLLIHLNRIDYKTSLRKHIIEQGYTWNPFDLKRTTGWHHRFKNKASFENYFKRVPGAKKPIEDIPGWVKKHGI